MKKVPAVYCIIVTFNGERFIRKCLDNLLECIGQRSIIVIDNFSNDNTAKIIMENYGQIRLIRMDRNFGFGQANNIGFKAALKEGADYLFLLNQDVYVTKGTIAGLVSRAETNPDYAIISPMHLNGTGDAIDHHFTKYTPSQFLSDLYLGHPQELYPCKFVNAAAWLVSRKCAELIGGFDPLFFHYGEDDDYLNRVRFHKMKIGICPCIKVNHDRGFYNSMTNLTGLKQAYLHALKGLKNINFSYSVVVRATYVNLFCQAADDLVFFEFKSLFTLIKASFKILFKLKQIYKSRQKSKAKSAFL